MASGQGPAPQARYEVCFTQSATARGGEGRRWPKRPRVSPNLVMEINAEPPAMNSTTQPWREAYTCLEGRLQEECAACPCPKAEYSHGTPDD
ncbi:hypothetical protein IAQ61_009154 [Plenodomus lingam]|uniref:uncharacterized protein n=1 Tax=Leptosphaeria maculans TaxID=5022 RepID=UPI00332F34A0|nr:hypothetical protein IAQ61_009154 [Plenodomus lingam]